MTVTRKSKGTWEFGDFQTPDVLALQIVHLLQQLGISASSIIEPTCGKGSLLVSAIHAYPHAQRYIGADINADYLKILRERISNEDLDGNIEVLHTNFFDTDWDQILATLPQPILVIGNPPWVTSSDLGMLNSNNIPEKSNFHSRNGLDALTGKSNFDISEWILLKQLSWLQSKEGTIAVLCKTAVARKILTYAWKNEIHICSSKIFKIDAKQHFDASVDACLLVMQFEKNGEPQSCSVFPDFVSEIPSMVLGYQDNLLIANMISYQNLRHLAGEDNFYVWRSGIKHDCSNVMELVREGESFVNGNAVVTSLEEEFLYPLLKSSDIGNSRVGGREKYMLVTQKYIGEDTDKIKVLAPMTWNYLQSNSVAFANRGSSIYKNRPDFSIFGVGDYTFAPWKVAISGFYKRLNFVVVPPINGKAAVFDDTVYFLSCLTENEAHFVFELLNSEPAKDFLEAMIFWQDKRPITIEILKRLDLQAVAREIGMENAYIEITKSKGVPIYLRQVTQQRLFEKKGKYR